MSQQVVYETHHKTNREAGFSILKDERGNLLRNFIGQGKDVLDLGCRDGALTKYFVAGNRVVGVDVDEVALSRARELGIETVSMDLLGEWVELGEKRFDVAVLGEVLEHLYYPEVVISKIYKVLKPGGVLLGSVPNAFSLKNRLRYLMGSKRYTPLSDPTHINQFSATDLEDVLRNKFSEVEIIGLGRYAKLARLSPNLFGFDLFFKAIK